MSREQRIDEAVREATSKLSRVVMVEDAEEDTLDVMECRWCAIVARARRRYRQISRSVR